MEKHILVLTHGDFGESLLKSAQMIIGEVSEVTSVSLTPETLGIHSMKRLSRRFRTYRRRSFV